MPATDQITPDEWKSVTQKRILFGHQSVGNNILAGVRHLAKEAGVKLHVTESRSAMTDFGITHFKIGQNEDPRSKIKDFADTLRVYKGQNVDIALMKLCYIDIKKDTDVKKLAEDYISSLSSLSNQYPNTTFIAVTTPITTVQHGPKAWIKYLTGQTPSGYIENYRRHQFNDILRNVYSRQGRLFDLAKIEAEGNSKYQYQGHPLEILNPVISSDGGHLNSLGERLVAARMLKFIATLPFHHP